MPRLLAFILAACFFSCGDSRAAGNPSTSANGRIAVEVSEPQTGQLLVTVLGVTNGVKTYIWGRTIPWKRTYEGRATIEQWVTRLVTNSGETVVLRDREPERTPNGVTILRKDGAEVRTVKLFDRLELTGMKGEDERGKFRMGVSYRHVGSLFEFLLEEEENYAAWFGQTDQWALISLRDGSEQIVTDEATLARLNRMARQRALQIVSEHQPPSYRRAFDKLRANAAKLVPALGSPGRRRYMDEEATTAYVFLTARKFESDRSWIAGLITQPARGIGHGHATLEGELKVSFDVSLGERLIGDFLLDRWDGATTNREFIYRERMLLVPMDTYRYLGSIKVDLDLPSPVPEDKPGLLWAYLIPDSVPVAQWANAEEVMPFRTSLYYMPHRPEGLGLVGPQGEVVFHGITPGEYRVKLVWERSSGRAGFRTNIYLPLPGDYESPETVAVTVKAGELVTLTNVACTNFVKGAAGPLEN